MQDAVDAVEEVFRAHGQGRVALPPKISLDMRPLGVDSRHNAMPAYVAPLDAAGIKWAGGYRHNPSKHGLPYVMALVVLQEPETGLPLAVMDGAHITAIRTGAVAAYCARLYGRPDGAVALIGAGEQAHTTLEAMTLAYPPSRVTVQDLLPERAQAFAAWASRRFGLQVVAADDVRGAVRDADVIVTATPADAPLVEGGWLAPGSTCISLGSFQEFDDAAVLDADKIVVDSWEQCAHRGELKRFAEDGRITRADIHAEIGETAAGSASARTSNEERVFVVPIGLGSHDIALARLAVDRAGGQPRGEIRFPRRQQYPSRRTGEGLRR